MPACDAALARARLVATARTPAARAGADVFGRRSSRPGAGAWRRNACCTGQLQHAKTKDVSIVLQKLLNNEAKIMLLNLCISSKDSDEGGGGPQNSTPKS